jgi:hypothetical protein
MKTGLMHQLYPPLFDGNPPMCGTLLHPPLTLFDVCLLLLLVFSLPLVVNLLLIVCLLDPAIVLTGWDLGLCSSESGIFHDWA